MTSLHDVSEMLKQARSDAKLSQQALASRAGVARTTVARMETLAKGDMSVSVLVRLLEAAGYDLKRIEAEHLNFYLNDELYALLSNVNSLPPAVRG